MTAIFALLSKPLTLVLFVVGFILGAYTLGYAKGCRVTRDRQMVREIQIERKHAHDMELGRRDATNLAAELAQDILKNQVKVQERIREVRVYVKDNRVCDLSAEALKLDNDAWRLQ